MSSESISCCNVMTGVVLVAQCRMRFTIDLKCQPEIFRGKVDTYSLKSFLLLGLVLSNEVASQAALNNHFKWKSCPCYVCIKVLICPRLIYFLEKHFPTMILTNSTGIGTDINTILGHLLWLPCDGSIASRAAVVVIGIFQHWTKLCICAATRVDKLCAWLKIMNNVSRALLALL